MEKQNLYVVPARESGDDETWTAGRTKVVISTDKETIETWKMLMVANV